MANTYQSDNELHAPTANEEEGDDAYYRPIRRLQQDNGRDDSTPYEPLKPRASSEVLLRRLHNVTDYDFDDQGLAWEALQADGSMIRWSGHRVFINGKTRLAVVGDRVAELVLSLDWYQWVEDDMQPGKETYNAKRKHTSDAVMSHIGITSGLADAYSLYTMNPLRLSQKPVATLMEAVIGAIYLDCGQEFGPVRDCMRKMGMMYDSPEIEILATKKGQPKELCSCGLEHRWTEK